MTFVLDYGAAHEHTFRAWHASDDTHHWYPATCNHTDVKKEYEEHTFDDVTHICECGDESHDYVPIWMSMTTRSLHSISAIVPCWSTWIWPMPK